MSPLDRLQSFFRNNGYIRTDTVREPGEFAVRGGIVDLYPAGAAQPLRLDFFGDAIESIRSFDPLTQRSTGTEAEAVLRPVSEVLLDDDAVRRFRQRYREEFGATGTDDPLYESVSAGRRYVGMEHWLPLYYERLETLFDYLPGAGLSFDHQASEVRAHRLEQIAEFYAARRNVTGSGARRRRRSIGRCAPDQLYLDEREWQRRLPGGAVGAVVAVRRTRSRTATGSTPARGRRAISPPSAPTPRWRCSRRCATISKPSANPAARPRSPRSARARPTGSPTVLRERGVADLRRIADGAALAALPALVGRARDPAARAGVRDRRPRRPRRAGHPRRPARAHARGGGATSTSSSPRRPTSRRATSSSMPITASAATRRWRRSTSAARRTTACACSMPATTGCSSRSRTSRSCRASAPRMPGRSSTGWAGSPGSRARRGSSSASATSPAN